MELVIGPTEKRNVPLKTYVEKSVSDAVLQHQARHDFFSVSDAIRDLLIRGIEVSNNWPPDVTK